jgi:N-acetylmuramoyl-L-alanine amidase
MVEPQNIKAQIVQALLYALCAITLSLVWAPAAAAAQEPVKVVVEGQELAPPVPPQIVDGRTVLPIRSVGEALGATVHWDGASRTVTIGRRHDIVVLTIDKAEALVNGRPVPLDVPAQIIDDRAMVPLRFVGEAFGDGVQWDPETRTVFIWRRPTVIRAMHLVKDIGKARIDLHLSEPLLDWNEQLLGKAVVLDLYPAVIALPDPARWLGDPLLKSLLLLPGEKERSVRFAADLWREPRYRVAASADGTLISITIDYDVTGIEYKLDGYVPTVFVAASGPLNYATHVLREPDRIVIDIAGAGPVEGVPEALPVGHDLVKGVRSSHYAKGPDATRVVIDLNYAHAFEVTRTDVGLIVRLLPQLTGVSFEKLQGRTRLTLAGSQPLGEILEPDIANKKLRIRIPQAQSTLTNPLIQVGDGAIHTVSVTQGPTPGTLLVTVDLPYYLGHQLVSKAGDRSLVIDLITSPIYGKKIFVDPGHGGTDGGAAGVVAGPGLEKLVNLQLSLQLQRVLIDAGAVVFMSRTTDATVDLQERTQMVNAARPDVVLSIHHNSTARREGTARGTETYYFTPQSKTLAERIHAAFIAGTGIPDRKVRQENFFIIRETSAPSILLEVGFLDNRTDEALARDPDFQKKAALAIRQGLFDYFTQLVAPSQGR